MKNGLKRVITPFVFFPVLAGFSIARFVLSRIYQPFDYLVTGQTCPGKKIEVVSNRPNQNTFQVLVASPLTTLSVISSCNSEVWNYWSPSPSMTVQSLLEVLCHSLPPFSWLYGVSLWWREEDLFTWRPKYQPLSPSGRIHLHQWRYCSYHLTSCLQTQSSPPRCRGSSPRNCWRQLSYAIKNQLGHPPRWFFMA